MHVVLAELGKLRRYGMVKAGCLVTILAALYGFAPALARDGVEKTFPLVMNNLLESNCIYFFPAMIVLIGGCMARREYTDDTLKNLLTVPLSLRRLLLGKLAVLFFMTAGFSVLSFLLGAALCFAMGLPDAALPVLAEWLARIVAGNLLVFVAVLPLTLLASLFVEGVYACTAVAFVYGFFASMEAAMLNYYPAKAVLILVDPRCGVGYDFVHYSPASAILTLLAVLVGSVVLFALVHPGQGLNKVKSPKKPLGPKAGEGRPVLPRCSTRKDRALMAAGAKKRFSSFPWQILPQKAARNEALRDNTPPPGMMESENTGGEAV